MRSRANIFLLKRFSVIHPPRALFCSSGALSQNVRPYKEIPGPKPLPLLGNKLRFMPGLKGSYKFNDLVELHSQVYKEFGPIVRFSGLEPNNDMVFVYSPEDIETVFRNDGLWPHRPSVKSLEYFRTHTRKDFFKGTGGVLTDQGKEWQDARHQVNPILMQTKIVQTYTSKIETVAADFMKKIPQLINSKSEMPEDFQNELQKWALESIAMVALDTRLGCLGDKLEPDSEPQKMINSVYTLFSTLHSMEMGKDAFLWRLYPTSSWRKFKKVMNFFIDVSNKYVQQAIERSKTRASGTEPSALERLLERDPNPTRAVIMAIDMLMAGIDTTSHSLSNVLLHLSDNQEKQDILRKELVRILPDPEAPITVEKLNEMKYLKACVKESMRIMPVVTANMRRTQTEMVLSNFRIPKGVDVLLGNGLLSMQEKNYKNPNNFVPERWIRGGEFEEKAHPFVTMPFGHGARKCIGMRFALLEMEILLAKMMRQYRWEFKYGPMKYESYMVHAPANPLKFTVHKLE